MRHSVVFAVPSVVLVAFALACAGPTENIEVTAAAVPSAAPAPPPAPTGPKKPDYPASTKQTQTDAYGSVKVADDYRWLEDWNDPVVKSWSESENGFARKWLDGIAQRGAIHSRVEALMSASTPTWDAVTSRRAGAVFFALENKPPKQHPALVVFTKLTDLDPSASSSTPA